MYRIDSNHNVVETRKVINAISEDQCTVSLLYPW